MAPYAHQIILFIDDGLSSTTTDNIIYKYKLDRNYLW